MKYIGTIAAIATTMSSTKNRTLPRWSANSLAAIVRQPPGRGALGAPGGPRGVGARVSAGAAIGGLRDIAAIQLEQVRAATSQVDDGQARGGERRGERGRDVARRRHDPEAVVALVASRRSARRGRSSRPGRSPSGRRRSPPRARSAGRCPGRAPPSGPAATRRPAEKNPTRSHSDCTWPRMCEDSSTVRLRSATRRRSSASSSSTPDGSIAIVGSSRMSTVGSLTRASAMPRRWRMPRE